MPIIRCKAGLPLIEMLQFRDRGGNYLITNRLSIDIYMLEIEVIHYFFRENRTKNRLISCKVTLNFPKFQIKHHKCILLTGYAAVIVEEA